MHWSTWNLVDYVVFRTDSFYYLRALLTKDTHDKISNCTKNQFQRRRRHLSLGPIFYPPGFVSFSLTFRGLFDFGSTTCVKKEISHEACDVSQATCRRYFKQFKFASSSTLHDLPRYWAEPAIFLVFSLFPVQVRKDGCSASQYLPRPSKITSWNPCRRHTCNNHLSLILFVWTSTDFETCVYAVSCIKPAWIRLFISESSQE